MAGRSRFVVLAGLVLAVLGVGACAARVARPPPPPWVAWPEAEVAAIQNPHDYRGQPLCQKCHESRSGTLKSGAIALCTGCHSFSHGNHPVDVVQKGRLPDDLPFLAGGRVACHTCHDPHAWKKFPKGLRGKFDDLCLKCHVRH